MYCYCIVLAIYIYNEKLILNFHKQYYLRGYLEEGACGRLLWLPLLVHVPQLPGVGSLWPPSAG